MAKIVAGQSELIYISNAKTWNCSVQELIESLASKIVANSRKHPCPGDNTVEMRYCAGQSWEQSTDQLKQKLPRQMVIGRRDDYKGSALVLTCGQRPEFARSVWCWK